MSEQKEYLETGSQVRLRKLDISDLDRRRDMTNDVELQKLTIGFETGERTEAELKSWFETLAKDVHSEQLAVEAVEDGTYIGDVDLHGIDTDRREAWISPIIGAWAYRTPEYLQDAIRTVMRYAVNKYQLERIWAEVLDRDVATVSGLVEVGFNESEQIDNMNGTKSLIFEWTRSVPGIA